MLIQTMYKVRCTTRRSLSISVRRFRRNIRVLLHEHKKIRLKYLHVTCNYVSLNITMHHYPSAPIYYRLEEYLKIVRNPANRISMTKLRLGVHTLRIQTGKYENKGACIPVEERLCLVCKRNCIEDENTS